MIYKFRSKAAGDVIMLGPNGDRVLTLMGKDPAPQGIIEPGQMAAAIEALTVAVAADDAARAAVSADDQTEGKPEGISLRQRVWPLVEMMKRALAEDQAIVWG